MYKISTSEVVASRGPQRRNSGEYPKPFTWEMEVTVTPPIEKPYGLLERAAESAGVVVGCVMERVTLPKDHWWRLWGRTATRAIFMSEEERSSGQVPRSVPDDATRLMHSNLLGEAANAVADLLNNPDRAKALAMTLPEDRDAYRLDAIVLAPSRPNVGTSSY